MAREQTPPSLYPYRGILIGSLVFTPIFGAILQAANWKALKKPEEVNACHIWIRMSVWMILAFVILQVLLRNEPWMQYSTPYFLFVMWFAWFITTGRRQTDYLKVHNLLQAPALPLKKAFFMGAAGWMGYMMISTTIAMGLYLFGFDEMTPPEDSGVVISVPADTNEVKVRPIPTQPKP